MNIKNKQTPMYRSMCCQLLVVHINSIIYILNDTKEKSGTPVSELPHSRLRNFAIAATRFFHKYYNDIS